MALIRRPMLLLMGAISVCLYGASFGLLSTDFYSSSCPQLEKIVKLGVYGAVEYETRIGASLLRLHFHDCFANGCDGSILLDDTATFTGEKNANPNRNSVRGYEVVDRLKSVVEEVCPGTVSCADILTLAARDSVVALGGPSWDVPLGRRDSRTANITAANNNIPSPIFDLSSLITSFSNQGLTITDLVSLSGGHTIGVATCSTFRHRIYNETNIDATFAAKLQQKCPTVGRNNSKARLDASTPLIFDNCYFRNLLQQKGLFHSDQALMDNPSTASLVKKYVASQSSFFNDFVKGMVRMGNIQVLTGTIGEIRTNCRKVN